MKTKKSIRKRVAKDGRQPRKPRRDNWGKYRGLQLFESANQDDIDCLMGGRYSKI